jgi:hypothetical protein
MRTGGLSVLVTLGFGGEYLVSLLGAPCAGVQHRVSVSILCPLVRPKKAVEPRVSDRIMVGTFSQHSACVASGAESVEHHRIMKPSSGNHQLRWSCRSTRRAQDDNTKTPPRTETGLDASKNIYVSAEGGEDFFLDILSYRTTYK